MKKIMAMAVLLAAFSAPALASGATARDGLKGEGVARHIFMKMDANGDGVVSEDEHEDFAENMFDAADTDHDDRMTIEEFMAYKNKEMAAYKNAR